MSDVSPPGSALRRRGRFAPLVWITSALTALLLTLGVSGTLSSWTQAIVSHDNTVSTGSGIPVLKVTNPDPVAGDTACTSSTSDDNTFACTTINLYGDDGVSDTSMRAGEINTTVVTLANTGTVDGTARLAPGACNGATALCNALLVTVTCVGAITVSLVTPMSLRDFATADTDLAGTLVAGGPVSTCTVVLTLPLSAPITTVDKTISQQIVWSLTV